MRFYSDLFSQEFIDPVCKQLCFDSISSSLSPPLRDSCEGLLPLDELACWFHPPFGILTTTYGVRLDVMSRRHCTYPTGGLSLRLIHKKLT